MAKPRIPGVDWNLGPLVGLDPKSVLGPNKDLVGEFVLSLALVFNDIKTVVLIQHQISRARQHMPTGVNPLRGQADGVNQHMQRLGAGILRELLQLIESQAAALDDPEFHKVIEALSPEYRQRWDNLVSQAADKDTTKLLADIRANVAFHNHQPKTLAKGYREHFLDDAENDYNRRAYASAGADMDATRFYFADAAATRAMAVRHSREMVVKTIDLVLRNANVAIFGVVTTFLAKRCPAAERTFPKPQNDNSERNARKRRDHERQEKKRRRGR